MNLPTRPIAFGFALALALGGCGSDGGISAAAQARLAPLVRQVRDAAESHDTNRAQRSLTELQRAVASFEKTNEISEARATQILAAAARVQGTLGLVATTTTTTTTTTTIPDDDRDHGKNGNDGDKGRGKGKD